MDIGDCNSEILISFSEDNPCRLTHFLLILSQTAIRRYCVQLIQYRQWRDWMRKNLGTVPDNHSMGNINDIIAFTQEKTEWYGTIVESLRNVPQRCRSWSSTSFNSANIKHTSRTHYSLPKHKADGNAHYSLEESATEPFSTHWRSDKNKQSNAKWHAQQWQQDSVTN